MTYQQILASLVLILGATAGTIASDAWWANTAFCTMEDPKTGFTCEQLRDDSELDVYYLVSVTEFYNNDLWVDAQQDPATVRWNNDHTKFILKYDALSIPRSQAGGSNALLNPMNNSEVLLELNKPEWLVDIDAPIVEKDKEQKYADPNL